MGIVHMQKGPAIQACQYCTYRYRAFDMDKMGSGVRINTDLTGNAIYIIYTYPMVVDGIDIRGVRTALFIGHDNLVIRILRYRIFSIGCPELFGQETSNQSSQATMSPGAATNSGLSLQMQSTFSGYQKDQQILASEYRTLLESGASPG